MIRDLDRCGQAAFGSSASVHAQRDELLTCLQFVECVYRKNCVNEGEPSSVLEEMQRVLALCK